MNVGVVNSLCFRIAAVTIHAAELHRGFVVHVADIDMANQAALALTRDVSIGLVNEVAFNQRNAAVFLLPGGRSHAEAQTLDQYCAKGQRTDQESESAKELSECH